MTTTIKFLLDQIVGCILWQAACKHARGLQESGQLYYVGQLAACCHLAPGPGESRHVQCICRLEFDVCPAPLLREPLHADVAISEPYRKGAQTLLKDTSAALSQHTDKLRATMPLTR